MQINEDDCIRYLMREMDPSEEIEFEREMMSNENLLIEVESLRSTYNKVKKLPIKETPEYVLEEVKKQAIIDQQEKLKSSYRVIGWFGKGTAAAATILLLVSAGTYFFNMEGGSSDLGTGISSPINVESNVQPWVDRSEILRVSDRTDVLRAEQIGDEYEKSFEKLKRVNPSNLNDEYRRQGVLLTRSRANQ